MRRFIIGLAAALAIPAMAAAEGVKYHDFDGSFDDAAFAVENAIVGEGLVVDFVSYVGTMLNRTQADVIAYKLPKFVRRNLTQSLKSGDFRLAFEFQNRSLLFLLAIAIDGLLLVAHPEKGRFKYE